MKKLLLILGLLTPYALGQGVSNVQNVTTTATNVPAGAQAPVMTVPNALVTICSFPAVGSPLCTNTAPIFSDVALTHPITQPGQGQLIADPVGRFQFWASPGNYEQCVQNAKGILLGCTPITLGASGGAGNPASPAFCVQSANAGVNGFQCDPQILINPTTHTLTSPNVNSFINSDLFNTGGGNNGVPNALASPICAAGCTLQVPSNTPNNVNPAGNSAFINSVKTSIWDQTGGTFWYTSNNAQSNELGPTVHFPLVFQTSYSLDPIGVGTESGGGLALTDLESSSGFDISGQPTVRTGFQLEAVCNTPGICQAMHINQFGLGGDDKGALYLDQNVRANNTAGGSEGNQMASFTQSEIRSTPATVVTGGQGTNNILTNVAAAWGVNLFLESSTEVYASGGITSLTASGGLDPNVVNTSDTHAVVNTVGTLTSPCGTPANNNNKISETCSVTNSGSINTGAFCVTGAWNGSSCVGSAHVAVMIADTINPECSFITAIGSGTITL
jgi:hypothetical protein